MLITALNEGASARAEAVLATIRGVGIRYYRAAPFRYDYSSDLAQQIEALKPRIGSLVRLNEKFGTTAMYHTHSAYGNIGGGVWDLWLAVKDFDPEFVGLNYDLGHATIRGGTGWIETSHMAHKCVHGLSVKDFRWLNTTSSPTAPTGRRGGDAPANRAPWVAEMVPGGEGMVDFKRMLSYFKSVGFADFGRWKLEMPKSQYVSLLKRDLIRARAGRADAHARQSGSPRAPSLRIQRVEPASRDS